ncbi:MAG TPA: HNH endonuclease [Leptospiraceae bacterium]|nr:HNH endonuclease [Leptospiraceae bacterium]
MIKINKPKGSVPDCLKYPPITAEATNTQLARDNIIRTGNYNIRYNLLYKTKEIKAALNTVYNGKCGYCETPVKVYINNIGNVPDPDYQRTVEHYRPKSNYYWLAFSWDNLLITCSRCNRAKLDNFQIKGKQVIYDPKDLQKINELADEYNELEKPDLIHPELEDVESKLEFDEYGKISSSDSRVKYTITTHKLDRPFLNAERKTVLGNLAKVLNLMILENKGNEEKFQSSLQALIENFAREANTRSFPYLAFRRFILKNFMKFFPELQ